MLQKEQLKKQQKQLGTYLAIKLLVRLQGYKKNLQKNCPQWSCIQMKLIMKYQKKDIFFHKKDNKLLMNED